VQVQSGLGIVRRILVAAALIAAACVHAQSTGSLHVFYEGAGSGYVGWDLTPLPLACQYCDPQWPLGTKLTLTANPAAGSRLDTWSGACASAGASPQCVLIMDGPKSVTATFSLLAPRFVSATATKFALQTPGTFTVKATGTPAPALTLFGALPNGITFDTVTGVLAGTSDAPGKYNLQLFALNPSGYDFQNFTLTITSTVNHPPVATSRHYTVMAGTGPFYFALEGQDPDGDPLTFDGPTRVQHGEITVFGGIANLYRYWPPSNYVGPDTTTFVANDGFVDSERATITFDVGRPGRLVNISTRANVGIGEGATIPGFIIGGSSAKRVVVSVAGPSLVANGITNPLVDPSLVLVRSSDQAIIAYNDDWQAQQTPQDLANLVASGLQPNHPAEPALFVSLDPGAYSVVVSGRNGGTGIGVVGLFEVDPFESPLVNVSTRGRVLIGNDVMIAGFIVQGSTAQKVVVNVAGPSLRAFGIASPLADPTLTVVRSSDQSVIAINDDWQAQASPGDVALIQASGFEPKDVKEPALMLTLQPGAYTAIVSGAGGTTGVGLVGVFAVP
jgi:hypothetical protein